MRKQVSQNELLESVAKKASVDNEVAEKVFSAFVECLKECIGNNEDVTIPSVGTFISVLRPAHKRFHPITGEERDIPERTSVRFEFDREYSHVHRHAERHPDHKDAEEAK